jgi:hypothetical protein
MKPTDAQIEQTILAIQLRLAEPILQQLDSIHYRAGYQTMLYILQHRITDMQQINRLHFDGNIPLQLAQMAVNYQLGECLKFDLLYMPIQRLPEAQQQIAFRHGKLLYEEIQRTSVEELTEKGLTGFVEALRLIRDQNGLTETFLFVADMSRRNRKPMVEIDIHQSSMN